MVYDNILWPIFIYYIRWFIHVYPFKAAHSVALRGHAIGLRAGESPRRSREASGGRILAASMHRRIAWAKNAQCHAVPWSSIIWIIIQALLYESFLIIINCMAFIWIMIIIIHLLWMIIIIPYHSWSIITVANCSHRSLWLQGWKLKMLGLAQKLFRSTVRPHEFHCFGSSAACDWLIGLVCTKCEGSSCLATLIEFREQTRDWQLSCFRNSCKCRMLKVIPKISTPFVITFCLLGVNAAETCWNLFKSLARGKKQSDQIECTHIISHHCWKTTAWFPCKFVSGFKAV